MVDLIIVIVLFSILLLMEHQDRKKIIIESYKSFPHSIVYVLIFIAMLVLFKSDSLENNIQLFIMALLVLNFGIQKEGLGEEKFIKSGHIFSSDYEKYKIVEISPYLKESSQLYFKKTETDKGVSIVIERTPEKLKNFFEETVSTNLNIRIEE